MDDFLEKLKQEMNLRKPQADSLTKFSDLLQPVDLASLEQKRIKHLLERGTLSFPDSYARLTFALATGVGKTKLMGAMMAWLYLSGKSRHFVMLAPSSTIYKKMQNEAIPTYKKYIFAGISQFPIPEIVTADTVEGWNPEEDESSEKITIFILTPGQIRPRTGGEAERRLRQENETLGESFLEHLNKMNDLVAFLDEGHRYGQDANHQHAWARAVVDLNPKLVVEMTATPTNESTILHKYTLSEALRDGLYVKNVEAIYEQRNQAVTDEEWDHLTLREGLKQLEIKKKAIEAFRTNYPERKKVKPIILVACRDTQHSQTIENWLQSQYCEGGKYRGKVLRVDITQSEEEIAKLLEIESPEDPIEIVVNVGMLREGWDVENVYAIAPLRATVSETLATQTIGRGLRLPYGERVGDFEVDTLHVLAFGRETVQSVIEAAKAVGALARHSGPSGAHADYRQYTIKPAKKISIPFPVFAEKTVKLPSIKSFHPQMNITISRTDKPTVTRIEVLTGRISQDEALVVEGVTNFSKRLGQLLVESIPELGGEEKEATRIFKEYLKKSGCKNAEEEKTAVQSRGKEIFDDVETQINNWFDAAKEELENLGEEESFTFRDIEISAPVKIFKKDDALLPRDKSNLIEEWKRSLYPRCRFDTKQELEIAKILDNMDDLIWVRNPVHQFTLDTALGKHFPDFVVLHKNRIIFIESKNTEELHETNSEAHKKGEEVTQQCEMANRSSKQKWQYWAIPHDQVENCATLEDLGRHRFRF